MTSVTSSIVTDDSSISVVRTHQRQRRQDSSGRLNNNDPPGRHIATDDANRVVVHSSNNTMEDGKNIQLPRFKDQMGSFESNSITENENNGPRFKDQVQDVPPLVQAIPMVDEVEEECSTILVCPISKQIMKDPVQLFPSGITCDRKCLCQALIRNHNVDPVSGKKYNKTKTIMSYKDNIFAREMLIQKYGKDAYQPYDDSQFHLLYEQAWSSRNCSNNNNNMLSSLSLSSIIDKDTNNKTINKKEIIYEKIQELLFGMNRSYINIEKALELVQDELRKEKDMVLFGIQALILDPRVEFIHCRIHDNCKARHAWKQTYGSLYKVNESSSSWLQWIESMKELYCNNDKKNALFWCQQAAHNNHITAQAILGRMYQYGIGIQQIDYNASIYWYRKAASQGHASAANNLGRILLLQKHNNNNLDNNNSYNNQHHRSHCCSNTTRTDNNNDNNNESFTWFVTAAKQGHTPAMYNLGRLLEQRWRNDGNTNNLNSAIMWYQQASAQDHVPSKRAIDHIHNVITVKVNIGNDGKIKSSNNDIQDCMWV